MYTKLRKTKKKRVTVQVRISKEIHTAIKLEAVKSGETMSKLVDEILLEHLGVERVTL